MQTAPSPTLQDYARQIVREREEYADQVARKAVAAVMRKLGCTSISLSRADYDQIDFSDLKSKATKEPTPSSSACPEIALTFWASRKSVPPYVSLKSSKHFRLSARPYHPRSRCYNFLVDIV